MNPDDDKITFKITMGKVAISNLVWLMETIQAEGLNNVVRTAFSWLHYTVKVLTEGGVVWVMNGDDVRQISMDDIRRRGADKPDTDG